MQRWQKIRDRLLALCCGFSVLIPLARGSELVLATTFAQEGVQHLLEEWHKQPNAFPVTTLSRTSSSLSQLFATERAKDVDLILSSSPMLFHNLQQKQMLAVLPPSLNRHPSFVPPVLQQTTVAFSLSGYGMLINANMLAQQQIPLPTRWQDLADPALQGLVIISSPTRSDTNHIMLETILQQHGWEEGWALLNQIMANVGTISSRSFGVADKINVQLGAVGITIDNYANLLTSQQGGQESPLVFHYFSDFTVSPTFIAVNKASRNAQPAWQFVRFLLSRQGQGVLNHREIGKFPIEPLPPESPHYNVQQTLFRQPQINYDLLLKRQTLVKLLFEQQITYRLNQLQENWQLLHQKEAQLARPLPQLRAILNRLPVSAEQALDEDYLAQFNTEQTLLEWQKFFISQQLEFIKTLEMLE